MKVRIAGFELLLVATVGLVITGFAWAQAEQPSTAGETAAKAPLTQSEEKPLPAIDHIPVAVPQTKEPSEPMASEALPQLPAAEEVPPVFVAPGPLPTTLEDEPQTAANRAAESSVLPKVELRQKVPQAIGAGQTATIELSVNNLGPVAVDNVIVTEELGSDVEFVKSEPNAGKMGEALAWSLGALKVGEHRTILVTVQPKADVKVPTLQSTAALGFLAKVSNTVEIDGPKLTLSLTGPQTAAVGERATFAIAIANVSDQPISGILLADNLPEGLSHPFGPNLENEIGTLAPGEKKEIELTLTTVKEGTFTNKVLVRAKGIEPVTQQTTLEIGQPTVAMEGDSPKLRFLNRPCTYRFTVTNTSQKPLDDARVVTLMPKGLSFARASEGGKLDPALRTVQWTFGALKPGEHKSVTLTGIATETGDQVCKAVVASGSKVVKETQATTTIKGAPALLVEVFDVDDPIEVGAQTIYEIHVVNQGTTPATNVQISATIPEELEAMAADGPTTQQLVGNALTFEPVASVAPKEDLTFRVKVKGTKAGDLRFRTSVTAEQLSKPIIEEESTRVYGEKE